VPPIDCKSTMWSDPTRNEADRHFNASGDVS
jgi:hypothetical protein